MLAASTNAGGATLLPGRIKWTTAFWPLFTGRVHMTMRQSEAMPDAVTVDATTRGATLSVGRQIGVPATLLAELGAPFNTLNFEGDVRLSWTDFHVLAQNAYGQLMLRLTTWCRACEAAGFVSGRAAGAGRASDHRSVDEQGSVNANRQRRGLAEIDDLSGQGDVRARSA